VEYIIAFAILLAISVVILIISMFITSALGGGVEFGEVHIVLAKAIPLLIVIALLELVPFGVFLAIPVWWFGLMLLFRLDFWEVRTLVFVNWGLNALVHYALLAMLK
jgi:hypothetical protein